MPRRQGIVYASPFSIDLVSLGDIITNPLKPCEGCIANGDQKLLKEYALRPPLDFGFVKGRSASARNTVAPSLPQLFSLSFDVNPNNEMLFNGDTIVVFRLRNPSEVCALTLKRKDIQQKIQAHFVHSQQFYFVSAIHAIHTAEPSNIDEDYEPVEDNSTVPISELMLAAMSTVSTGSGDMDFGAKWFKRLGNESQTIAKGWTIWILELICLKVNRMQEKLIHDLKNDNSTMFAVSTDSPLHRGDDEDKNDKMKEKEIMVIDYDSGVDEEGLEEATGLDNLTTIGNDNEGFFVLDNFVNDQNIEHD